MKKILWVSAHQPIAVQLNALSRLFGEVTIEKLIGWPSAESIVERFSSEGFDEMVIVAPLSVIAKVLEKGVKPLWAQMEQQPSKEGADLEYRGRFFKFVEFRRIERVALEFGNI